MIYVRDSNRARRRSTRHDRAENWNFHLIISLLTQKASNDSSEKREFQAQFPIFPLHESSLLCFFFFLHQAEFNLVTLYSVTQLSWCHAVIFPRKTSHNIVPLIAVQHSIYITFDMKLLSLLYVRLCLFLHELCLELDVNMWDSSSSAVNVHIFCFNILISHVYALRL